MVEQTCGSRPPEDPDEDDDETEGPLLAVDVHYAKDGSAVAAGIAFGDWHNATRRPDLGRHPGSKRGDTCATWPPHALETRGATPISGTSTQGPRVPPTPASAPPPTRTLRGVV